jgi:hypothetical protein
MSIRFGTESGYKTRTDFRISEGELDCGDIIYMFIKTIEKSYTFEDEYSICSIGIIPGSGDNPCYESISLKIREEAAPKYKPTDEAREKTPEYLAQMAIDGKAATELACIPIKIKMTTVELTASYKDVEVKPDPVDLENATTADGVYRIGDLIVLPATGSYILTSFSTDQPTDDFGTRSITYTKKLPYPDDQVRQDYLTGIADYFPLDDPFDPTTSTVEVEVNFRQGDVPIKRVTVTKYGVISIDVT